MVSVEEGPGRNDEDEEGASADQADVDGELDVLEEIPDEEGDSLETKLLVTQPELPTDGQKRPAVNSPQPAPTPHGRGARPASGPQSPLILVSSLPMRQSQREERDGQFGPRPGRGSVPAAAPPLWYDAASIAGRLERLLLDGAGC